MMMRAAIFASLLLCTLQISRSASALPRFAGPALAPQDDMNFTLDGKITQKSAGKFTVTSGENMLFHVVYNDKTEIKKQDGSPGTDQDLRVGASVSVAGDLAESGIITAKKIDIKGEKGNAQ